MDEEETRQLRARDRFNNLHWHDSKLLGIHALRSLDGLTDEVCINLRLVIEPGRNQWKDAKVLFKDCTLIMIDLDLAGKRVCSDDIAIAYCEKESALKNKIQRDRLKNEENALAGFLHFCVSLIHPGGEINIFARDFEVSMD